jgi:hypothetical protein
MRQPGFGPAQEAEVRCQLETTDDDRSTVREYQQYIGGEWVGSGELFDDLDPFRGTVMARIAAGTRADAARAVDAAAAAFPA